MMKVSELIEKLKKFNPDDIIFANYDYEYLSDGELYFLNKDLKVLDVEYNEDYEAVMLVCSEDDMRTKMTTEIVCPYCGARQDRGIRNIEVYSITYTETECEYCGKEFLFKVNIFYSSKKKGAE